MNMFVKKGKVREVNGKITAPQGGGLKLVLSTATTNGALNCPTFNTLNSRWSKIRESLFRVNSYRTADYGLGYVADLAVQSDVWIMHLMCRDDNGNLSVEGLKKCLQKIQKTASYEHASVHVSNLLLESYPEMVELLKEELLEKGVDVVSYTGD